MPAKSDMDEARLSAELVAALILDRPEHTAQVLAMLATALAVEARRHRSPTPETVATLLALNELQHALGMRLTAVLTYEAVTPAADFIEGLFAEARKFGCGEQWRLAVCDVVSVLMLWRLQDETDDEG